MKISINILTTADLTKFTELIKVFSEVFEMQQFVLPGEDHLIKTLANKDFIAVVALAENRVVGGMTVYRLNQYYSEKPLAYIYDLAVLQIYQRKGIGSALIEYIKEYCAANGFEEVFVQADRVDAYALEFYRSTGITEEEDVVHYYYKLTNT